MKVEIEGSCKSKEVFCEGDDEAKAYEGEENSNKSERGKVER